MIKTLSNIGYVQQPLYPNRKEPYLDSFYFNPSSVNQRMSACSWANVEWSFQKYQNGGGYFVRCTTTNIIAPTIRLNLPMKSLILLDIDIRGQGGRAYKVANTEDNSIFDIREDQMLQAILRYGIKPGGDIGGEWVWAMNHNQTKCFLTDSKEYDEALKWNKQKI